ncbi:MAG: alkane 1-monooxygenase, partial [Sphingopyxis sp.]|nr:alkane 1-monooxygenase [Sphingopyxis sp.]
PLAGYKDSLPPNARAILDHVLQCSAVGTADDIAAGLRAFVARTRVDEVIIASSMYDHDARKHSLALTMSAAKAL